MARTKESYNRLLRRVCATSRKQEIISKTQKDVSLLNKFLVSRNEPREMVKIDASPIFYSVKFERKTEGTNQTLRVC